MADLKLSLALEGKFRNVKIQPGKFHFKGQDYNFQTMDVGTAEKLVAEKCAYIEKVEKPSTPGTKFDPKV